MQITCLPEFQELPLWSKLKFLLSMRNKEVNAYDFIIF